MGAFVKVGALAVTWIGLGTLVVACSSGGTNGGAGVASGAEGATVGASGGTIEGAGVTLVVPAGALATDATITVEATAEPPEGYSPISKVYRFRPEGLTFRVPVEVRIPFEGDAAGAHAFWSSPSGVGFEDVGGAVASDGRWSTTVAHFSLGFVGRAASLDGGDVDGASGDDGGTSEGGAADAGTDAVPGEAGSDACSCASGLSCCGSACVDTMTSPYNCGACGHVCGTATPVCVSGVCGPPAT